MTVCLVGLGKSDIAPELPHLTYRDVLFAAVTDALADAALDHTEIQAALTASEDLVEGRSIADEFTTDALAAKLKPNDRICGDSLLAVLHAAMQIEAGVFDVVLVGGYEKSAEAQLDRLDAMAMDPFYDQPVCNVAEALAGMEWMRFRHETGLDRRIAALIAAKNHAAGAPYGEPVSVDQILAGAPIVEGITRFEKAVPADGAVAIILASEEKAKEIAARHKTARPLLTLKSFSFAAETSWNGSRRYGAFPHLKSVATRVYRDAGITDPTGTLAFAELDDRYAHREAMAALEFGLSDAARLADDVAGGRFAADGELAINPSGGRLGSGDLFTGAGTRALAETGWLLRAGFGEEFAHDFSAGQTTWLATHEDRRGRAAQALISTLFGPAATTGAAAVVAVDDLSA
ncbi:MAG: hypothetical protein P9L99_07970 [Candidatus Lernaella stagnicola]|nr:hypothetical protein [Candidatus Lernaella stagnicola]